jgi:hypothetical protein
MQFTFSTLFSLVYSVVTLTTGVDGYGQFHVMQYPQLQQLYVQVHGAGESQYGRDVQGELWLGVTYDCSSRK